MDMGAPSQPDEVLPYLYRIFMDPVRMTLPFSRFIRPALSRFWAFRRKRSFAATLAEIGGGMPLNRLRQNQARALEQHLNATLALPEGATLGVYLATRYARPYPSEVLAQMEADGTTKRIMLPLFPHYARSATGSCLSYWWQTERASERTIPTAVVANYALNRNYLQALNERITEGLQRFPRALREHVPLIFVARSTLVSDEEEAGCPYVGHLRQTIAALLKLRGENRSTPLAFLSKMGPVEWLQPSLPDVLRRLAHQGQRHALVVPLSFTSDHIKTEYEIDVEARAEASQQGFEQFEVAAGLNAHPLFIAALAGEASKRLCVPKRRDDTRSTARAHKHAAPNGAPLERLDRTRTPVFQGRLP